MKEQELVIGIYKLVFEQTSQTIAIASLFVAAALGILSASTRKPCGIVFIPGIFCLVLSVLAGVIHLGSITGTLISCSPKDCNAALLYIGAWLAISQMVFLLIGMTLICLSLIGYFIKSKTSTGP